MAFSSAHRVIEDCVARDHNPNPNPNPISTAVPAMVNDDGSGTARPNEAGAPAVPMVPRSFVWITPSAVAPAANDSRVDVLMLDNNAVSGLPSKANSKLATASPKSV